ncbi:MAG: hypothetical protein EOO65_05190 [Methanosarcinales archaeon]|nr:MAG: hypothetical protein EOO65_05190 [Methanosarcinales archaeon]
MRLNSSLSSIVTMQQNTYAELKNGRIPLPAERISHVVDAWWREFISGSVSAVAGLTLVVLSTHVTTVSSEREAGLSTDKRRRNVNDSPISDELFLLASDVEAVEALVTEATDAVNRAEIASRAELRLEAAATPMKVHATFTR